MTAQQYRRDETTGALISADDSQYQQILLKRRDAKDKQDVISRLINIENELTYIKDCLQTLLSRK